MFLLNHIKLIKLTHFSIILLILFCISCSARQPIDPSKKYDDLIPSEFRGGRLHWPVLGGKLTSKFGPRWGTFHDGVDIKADIGVPVLSAHNGEIVYADNGITGYGNLMIVKNKLGMMTIYAHLNRFLREKGDKVKRGDIIGHVGKTGRASGPHLHFEIRLKDSKGRYVTADPIPFFKSKNSSISPKYRVNNGLSRVSK